MLQQRRLALRLFDLRFGATAVHCIAVIRFPCHRVSTLVVSAVHRIRGPKLPRCVHKQSTRKRHDGTRNKGLQWSKVAGIACEKGMLPLSLGISQFLHQRFLVDVGRIHTLGTFAAKLTCNPPSDAICRPL